MSIPSAHKGQTDFTLVVETGIDLSTATVHQILYNKPSGIRGRFEATVSGTQLQYAIQPGDLNEAGYWKLESFVTINGLDNFGQASLFYVFDNLK